jgi:hypothetical protein
MDYPVFQFSEEIYFPTNSDNGEPAVSTVSGVWLYRWNGLVVPFVSKARTYPSSGQDPKHSDAETLCAVRHAQYS